MLKHGIDTLSAIRKDSEDEQPYEIVDAQRESKLNIDSVSGWTRTEEHKHDNHIHVKPSSGLNTAYVEESEGS